MRSENLFKAIQICWKKIDVSFVDTTLYCGGMLWDSKYKAEYKIDKELGEHYPNSNIIFTAYDHASMHEYLFENYDYVLLFVGEYCGEMIKRGFFPVYKTINGKWATPVDTYMEPKPENSKFKPMNITFDKSVYFDLPKDLSQEDILHLKKFKYPEKYYKIENRKAIPIMGRYAEDLVKLWEDNSTKSKE